MVSLRGFVPVRQPATLRLHGNVDPFHQGEEEEWGLGASRYRRSSVSRWSPCGRTLPPGRSPGGVGARSCSVQAQQREPMVPVR
eukprot:CAMPEP_0175432912 /NCGR_PEP_ID=MMETSP0095-20121207/53126_1 /TAXON_ID=311494 /ORGANISM="Alexandrium monilatum, Strain CCMP3105" /LENGTH=83 /DNA_ID=CAMNT_0016732423 /DNA_START=177 /DNA_END=424 /DNA_ORIENTATION=-